MSSKRRHALGETYAWPATMAVTTVTALVLGFVGTGWADIWAVIGLALPALYCAWKISRNSTADRRGHAGGERQ